MQIRRQEEQDAPLEDLLRHFGRQEVPDFQPQSAGDESDTEEVHVGKA